MFSGLTKAIKARLQQRIVALMLPTWPGGLRPDYFDRSFENYVKEGYKKNEIIYSCVNVTCNTASSVAMHVHDRASDAHLLNHPLQQLIQRPNRQMGEYDFWWWTLAHQMIGGVSYWQKIRNGSGQTVEMWPIRPDFVRPNISEGQGLINYQIKINGVGMPPIAPRDMIVFPLFDPLNLFDKTSPIEVVSRTADVDNAFTDLYKMIMQNGAMPMGVLTTKESMRDDDITDVQDRWMMRYGGGYANWLKPTVLTNGATYQRIGLTFDEMKSDSLDARSETRICMVFQIPPILIGGTFGLGRATFSNYAEARSQWWEDSLSGKYKKLLDGLQTQLADEYDDQPLLKWDFTQVAALQEERDGRWTRSQGACTAGIITVNEARKEMGLPSAGAEGDVFLRPTLTTAVPNNPTDDQSADTTDVGETEQEDEPTGKLQTEGKAHVKASKDEPLNIQPTDSLRWERLYQDLFKKVHPDSKAAVVTIPASNALAMEP